MHVSFAPCTTANLCMFQHGTLNHVVQVFTPGCTDIYPSPTRSICEGYISCRVCMFVCYVTILSHVSHGSITFQDGRLLYNLLVAALRFQSSWWTIAFIRGFINACQLWSSSFDVSKVLFVANL